MKSLASKSMFAAALFAASVGTSCSGWATTYTSGQSFDLNYNMSAAPYSYPAGTVYVGMNFNLSFSPGADFVLGDTLDLDVFNHLGQKVDEFDGYQILPGTGTIGLGVGYGIAPLTDPVGYLMVTLGSGTTFSFDLSSANAFLSPAATPLPSTWAMLMTGFVGLGFLGYLRSKQDATGIVAA